VAGDHRIQRIWRDLRVDRVSGGTDNHLMLVNVGKKNRTGKEVEALLDRAHITVNKNTIPFDPQKPFIASGIRIGSPAVTTRGMKKKEMHLIASWIGRAIDERMNPQSLIRIREEVKKLCHKFPVYRSHLK